MILKREITRILQNCHSLMVLERQIDIIEKRE